ncbi:MAG: hypothetical protein WC450_00690 [Candidatus Omnitrophota bacterium]|jgi:tRNA nucleotidyltransferase (CCA-adding enzyme)
MYKISWQHLNPQVKTLLQCVSRAGESSGIPVYIVGGTVRDILLQKRNVDLDCVVEGNAIALAQRVANLIQGELKTHERFQTATVTSPERVSVDFAMAREEHYPHPGALPVVRPGTLEADLKRRDFTINAMAAALHGPDAGLLRDLYNGVRDLRRRYIRILHDNSFIDDPTRILRGVRFEQRLNFKFEPRTARLLKSALGQNVFARIHPARYFTDFRKVLKEDSALGCVRRLRRLGCLGCFFKEYAVNDRVLAQVEKRRRMLPSSLSRLEADWPMIRFMALLAGLDKAHIEYVLKGVPVSRREKESLLGAIQATSQAKLLSVKRMASSDIYAILKPLALENIFFIRLRTSVKIVHERVDLFLEKLVHIKLDITGEDVQNALGKRSSRIVGRILAEVMEQKLNGRCPDRARQLEFIRERTCRI